VKVALEKVNLSSGEPGEITVCAQADGLESAETRVRTR
jgi:hypothetical protein